MSGKRIESVYFDKPGPENTSETLAMARVYLDHSDIQNVVVATTSGNTGRLAAETFADRHVVVVTHSTGFREPNTQSLTDENRAAIEQAGGAVLTTQHALGAVGRAVRIKLDTYQVDEIMAYTLRTLGQGVKVACEIALMAADAGLIRTDEDALVIGGSGRGADTAVVLRPANAMRFFDLRVREILCKPREF